jgi:hypothetical protein
MMDAHRVDYEVNFRRKRKKSIRFSVSVVGVAVEILSPLFCGPLVRRQVGSSSCKCFNRLGGANYVLVFS